MIHKNNISSYQFNKSIGSEIDTICEPFFKTFGITHFGYIRILPNNQMFRIANKPEWTEKFFEYEFYNDISFYSMEKIPINGNYSFLLFGEPQTAHCKALCNDFNIWNALTIYERFENYGSLWFFATTKENEMILDLYLNDLDILRKFILYFKEKAQHLLLFNDKSRIINMQINPLVDKFQTDLGIEKFLSESQISKYYLNKEENNISLSKREFECLKILSKGKTIKEVGKLLNLSPRTIESHINSAKQKTGCFYKDNIIDIIHNNI